MEKEKYYVYILSNKNRTVLYIGYTSSIKRRIVEHTNGTGAVFTKKYNVIELLYYEEYEDKGKAKARERKLKNWKKDWKWNLVKTLNPDLKTLKID